MKARVALLGVLLTDCGGGAAATGAPATDGGSTPPASSTYDTAQGFCSSLPALSGGDLTGTWTIVAACGISTDNPLDCANATMTLSFGASGTITFNPDDTGSIDVTVNLERKSTLPASCVPDAGGCPLIESYLSIGVDTDAGGTATCIPSSTDPSLCDCDEVFAPDVVQGSGGYSFELPNYIESTALGQHGGFVVQGDTLRLDGMEERGTEFDLIGQR
jgi:hypothetical protein